MTICARCEHFTLKTDPARVAAGEGQCIGFLEEIKEFVAWDAPTCRLYRRAKEMAPREVWIAARQAQSTIDGPDSGGAT